MRSSGVTWRRRVYLAGPRTCLDPAGYAALASGLFELGLIDRPIEEIGRTAAQLLLERLGGQADRPAQRITFPTQLILGGSCLPVNREAAEAN